MHPKHTYYRGSEFLKSQKNHFATNCIVILYEPDKIELVGQGGSGEAVAPVVIRFRIFTSNSFLQEIINCSNDPPAWPE